MRGKTCMGALIAFASLVGGALCEADATQAAQTADNNIVWTAPGPTITPIDIGPSQQGSVWVYSPTTPGAQWATQTVSTSTQPYITTSSDSSSSSSSSSGSGLTSGTVVAGMPGSPGRWQRRRSWRHQHQYPRQPVMTPGPTAAGAAALMGPSNQLMPAGASPMGPVPDPAAGQPAGTPAYIPGKGWATIIWQQPGQPGQPGPPGGVMRPGPQPAGMPGPGPGVLLPGQPRGPPMLGQPGSTGGPRLPGGTMPVEGSSPGPSESDLNPLSPPTPAEKAGGSGGGVGGSWGGRSSSGGSWASGVWNAGSSGGSSWGAWGGRRNGPTAPSTAQPSGSSGSNNDDETRDDDDDSDDEDSSNRSSSSSSSPPVWPWPGSSLSPGFSPRPSPLWGGLGTQPSPSPSPRPGSSGSWPGSAVGTPIGSGAWAGMRASPTPSPAPSSRWTPPSGPAVVTGPSRTDPDRPWLFVGRGASPSPSPRPGAAAPTGTVGLTGPPVTGRNALSPSPRPGLLQQGLSAPTGPMTGPGGAVKTSPTPSSSSSSMLTGPGADADEWDEGSGDDSDDVAVPRGSLAPGGGMGGRGSPAPGGAMGASIGARPGGSAVQASPSPRPGTSPAAAGAAAGSTAAGGFASGMQPGGGPMRGSPSPSPKPSAAADGGIVVVDDSNADVDVVDIEDDSANGGQDVTVVTNNTPGATGSVQPPGPVQGGSVTRPGGGTGSGLTMGPAAAGPGRSNATSATSGPGMGMGLGPVVGSGLGAGRPGGVGGMSESGPRTSSNASSTAAPTSGFTLSPTIAPRPGLAVGGMGSQPVVAASAADSSTQAPKSFLLETPGATKTILIGCVLPFEGSDQAVVGKAVHAALKMALQDVGPTLKLPVNVNLTCLNTRCTDIPAHNAMTQLAKAGAVAVIGDICSAASVAAAGVAGDKQVPLISPASSSPQLSGMPFFARTVPSDRYQGAAAAALVLQKGLKNVGMVYEDASYGYGLAFNFIASFTRDGGSVSPVVTFKKGQGDPKAAVDKMVEAKTAGTNPIQAVYVSTNNITYFTSFLRAAAAAKLDLPILGGDAIATPEVADQLQDNLAVLKPVHITAFNQGSDAFQKKFADANPGLQYDGNAAQGYDAMNAVLRAYMDAPPPKEPRDVSQQIPKQKFTGVSGPIAFDSKGDLLPHDAVYMTVTFDPKTGDMKFGEPIDLPDF